MPPLERFSLELSDEHGKQRRVSPERLQKHRFQVMKGPALRANLFPAGEVYLSW
jgi:hypothetical protein